MSEESKFDFSEEEKIVYWEFVLEKNNFRSELVKFINKLNITDFEQKSIDNKE